MPPTCALHPAMGNVQALLLPLVLGVLAILLFTSPAAAAQGAL